MNGVKKSILDKFVNVYLVLLIVGFLFIGVVPNALGISEGSISIPYRVFILASSVFLIFSILLSHSIVKIRMNKYQLFIGFWFFYTIRLVYDLYYSSIILAPNTSPSEYIQFAFGVVFLPSFCVILITQANNIDYDWVLKWIYRVLVFTLCVAIYSRGSSNIVGRSAGEVSIGVLLFGQYGATLSLLSLFYIIQGRNNFRNKLFYVIGFLIGFMGIFVSASKSPLLALMLVSLLFVIIWYGGLKGILLITIPGLLLYIFFTDIIYILNRLFKSGLFERILYAIEVGGDKTREKYMLTAINEFLDNPLFGNAILLQEFSVSGNYPHNIIVEAFMSLGFLGGIIILLWILKCVRKFYSASKEHFDTAWVGLLFMQYFIFALFSGNIFSNNLFWIFSILIIGVSNRSINSDKLSKG